MYDLLKASDGLIGHGTGNANVNGTIGVASLRQINTHVLRSSVPNDCLSTI